MNEQIWAHYDHACALFGKPDATVTDYRDAASYASYAVQLAEQAGENFSVGNSLLATIYYTLGEREKALEQANLTLKYRPDDFDAQHIKVLIAADAIQVLDTRAVVNHIAQGSGVTDMLVAAFAGRRASKSQNAFVEEVKQWVKIFDLRMSATDLVGEEYLMMSDRFFFVADQLLTHKVNFKSICKQMYTSVARVDITRLPFQATSQTEREQVSTMARDLKIRAQGRLAQLG